MNYTKTHIKFVIFLFLSFGSILSAIWNIVEEPTAGNWQNKNAYIILLLWIFPLFVNYLWGALAKSCIYIKSSFNLSIIYFVIYTYYALNGSSADEIAGAGHLHLYAIPLFMIIIQITMMIYAVARYYRIKQK